MSLNIKISVVQLGSIDSCIKINAKDLYLNQELTSRVLGKINVKKLKNTQIDKMDKIIKKCAKEGSNIVIFPELALTSFFPYFYIENSNILNKFFEKDDITKGKVCKLFKLAYSLGVTIGFGYAEITPGGRRFNTYVLYDSKGQLYKYRKVHIPGFEKPDPNRQLFQFEKGIFSSSDEGYPVFDLAVKAGNEVINVRTGVVICHDRRYNAPYLSMGMKGVQLIVNGYNTPKSLTFQKSLDKYVYKFHYLPLQAQAITEGVYILSAGRTGNNFGIEQIAGSCIVSPYGDIVCKTEHPRESILSAIINLDLCNEVKAQKYWGDRSRYDLLLDELVKNLEMKSGKSLIANKWFVGKSINNNILDEFALNKGSDVAGDSINEWRNDSNALFYIGHAVK
jgi:predicted amidohydrolase